jgi:hypothetical protein
MFNTRCCDLPHPDLRVSIYFLFNVDPDLTFHFDADSELDPDPDLLLVMRICDYWPAYPPRFIWISTALL